MKCNEIREMFGDYWDLPENDWNRIRVDEHIKRCGECAAEFKVWQESVELIQSSAVFVPDESLPNTEGVMSRKVMDRIYADETWRIPVASRIYSIPQRLRVRFTAIIACCLALFVCGFLYQIVTPGDALSSRPTSGVISVGSLGGDEDNEFAIEGFGEVEIASIGDPVVLAIPSVDSYPDLMLVLSFLGFVCALLTLNWFSRLQR
ncbi:anti-sigma factor family protein [Paenibacillus thermotolerans]|uniref:anti-sigma factor family protein n=1 Tax=Paenibacillus thermotolerans TaxID=3027807 RepID=UPI002368C9BD|nr:MULTISPECIES: zf-HC2 domain-containing protein [unclassified Paenibacillus]